MSCSASWRQRRREKVAPIFRHLGTSLCLKQLPAVPGPEGVGPGGGTVQRSLLQRGDRSVSAPSGTAASRHAWLPRS